jgi:hypothetical protein
MDQGKQKIIVHLGIIETVPGIEPSTLADNFFGRDYFFSWGACGLSLR